MNILQAMVEVGTLADLTWVVYAVSGHFKHQLFLITHDNEQMCLEFYQKLQQKCKKYIHNPTIAHYLVGVYDRNFLLENRQALEDIVGYHKVALSLAYLDRSYEIDRSKLDFFQYMNILAETDRPITRSEVWQEFIVWLLSIDPDYVEWTIRPSSSAKEYAYMPSLMDIRQIDWLVKSCHKMQMFDIICAIYDLDNHIRALAEITPMKHYDYETDRRNRDEFIRLAKAIAWEYQPNLLPEVSVYERLKEAFNKVGVEDQTSVEISYLTYEGRNCWLEFDEETNNYYFVQRFKTTKPIDRFQWDKVIAQANKEYNRHIKGSITEEGCMIKSEIFNVDHSGLFKAMFKSQLRSFLLYCSCFEELLSKL